MEQFLREYQFLATKIALGELVDYFEIDMKHPHEVILLPWGWAGTSDPLNQRKRVSIVDYQMSHIYYADYGFEWSTDPDEVSHFSIHFGEHNMRERVQGVYG